MTKKPPEIDIFAEISHFIDLWSCFVIKCLLKDVNKFSRSVDWRHKLCRYFVVLAVQMTLADFPRYAKGMLSIESQILFKTFQIFMKSHNRYNAHIMFALLFSYKKNDVVFGQKLQIANVPCTNPMGIRECCPLFQCRELGKRMWWNSQRPWELISCCIEYLTSDKKL